MYRSSSWSRVSEDYSVPWSAPKGLWKGLDEEESGPYDQTSHHEDVTKKEKSRAKFAENAVHIIPFVLLTCGLVLWFFSSPYVDVEVKGEYVATRIDGLTVESGSDGTQTGFLGGAAADIGGAYKKTPKHDVNKRHRKMQTSRKVV